MTLQLVGELGLRAEDINVVPGDTSGVALGLGVGVIIPFMHVILAVLLAIPVRANVAVAGACTLFVNPITIPPMYYAAYRIGSWELHHEALGPDPAAAREASGELARMLFWLHHASGPIALGILTISLSAAILGYAISALVWRLWTRSYSTAIHVAPPVCQMTPRDQRWVHLRPGNPAVDLHLGAWLEVRDNVSAGQWRGANVGPRILDDAAPCGALYRDTFEGRVEVVCVGKRAGCQRTAERYRRARHETMKKTTAQHVSISMAVAASPPAEPGGSYPGISPNG